MYDITLCPGENCPIKTQCYRFTAERLAPNDFFCGIPYNFQQQSCDCFMPPYRPTQDDIRTRAYYIWQSWGCPEGKALECWWQASRELRK